MAAPVMPYPPYQLYPHAANQALQQQQMQVGRYRRQGRPRLLPQQQAVGVAHQPGLPAPLSEELLHQTAGLKGCPAESR